MTAAYKDAAYCHLLVQGDTPASASTVTLQMSDAEAEEFCRGQRVDNAIASHSDCQDYESTRIAQMVEERLEGSFLGRQVQEIHTITTSTNRAVTTVTDIISGMSRRIQDTPLQGDLLSQAQTLSQTSNTSVQLCLVCKREPLDVNFGNVCGPTCRTHEI